jgi:hypothetical protein
MTTEGGWSGAFPFKKDPIPHQTSSSETDGHARVVLLAVGDVLPRDGETLARLNGTVAIKLAFNR